MADDRKPVDIYEILAITIALLGVVCLFLEFGPKALAFFLMFVGFTLHYVKGLREGVLSSRFFLLSWARAVDRDQSPFVFMVAAIIEGFWVIGLFIAFLFTL